MVGLFQLNRYRKQVSHQQVGCQDDHLCAGERRRRMLYIHTYFIATGVAWFGLALVQIDCHFAGNTNCVDIKIVYTREDSTKYLLLPIEYKAKPNIRNLLKQESQVCSLL